jgi:hypothetical protein
MAGWGDDPELEKLRNLLGEGWEVVEISEDRDAPGGPADVVKVSKEGATETITSDHLAFHRYVEGLREDQEG